MKLSSKRNRAGLLISVISAALITGCGLFMGHDGAKRPPDAEFGLGPRASSQHLYLARLEASQALRTRSLQTINVRITDAASRPIEGAVIAIDGGMPEHGHGLPTQPRVTRALGNGLYQIDGLRFSMGGWWELKLAIQASAGPDNITFNLDL